MTTDTIGGTAQHGHNTSYLLGFHIQASASGILTSVGVNVESYDGNLRLAIYSTYSGGKFSGLLGQAEAVAHAGWNDLPITGVTIVQGTTYYIDIQQSSGYCDLYIGAWTAGAGAGGSMTYGAFTDPSVSCSSYDYPYNMRIIYSAPTAPTVTTQAATGLGLD
jgi:hypothetical protein